MTISATQRKVSLFAAGGKRAKCILGAQYGSFVVTGYVGQDSSSEWVVLLHSCGAEIRRKRSQLHRVREQQYCSRCQPRRGKAGAQ